MLFVHFQTAEKLEAEIAELRVKVLQQAQHTNIASSLATSDHQLLESVALHPPSAEQTSHMSHVFPPPPFQNQQHMGVGYPVPPFYAHGHQLGPYPETASTIMPMANPPRHHPPLQMFPYYPNPPTAHLIASTHLQHQLQQRLHEQTGAETLFNSAASGTNHHADGSGSACENEAKEDQRAASSTLRNDRYSNNEETVVGEKSSEHSIRPLSEAPPRPLRASHSPRARALPTHGEGSRGAPQRTGMNEQQTGSSTSTSSVAESSGNGSRPNASDGFIASAPHVAIPFYNEYDLHPHPLAAGSVHFLPPQFHHPFHPPEVGTVPYFLAYHPQPHPDYVATRPVAPFDRGIDPLNGINAMIAASMGMSNSTTSVSFDGGTGDGGESRSGGSYLGNSTTESHANSNPNILGNPGPSPSQLEHVDNGVGVKTDDGECVEGARLEEGKAGLSGGPRQAVEVPSEGWGGEGRIYPVGPGPGFMFPPHLYPYTGPPPYPLHPLYHNPSAPGAAHLAYQSDVSSASSGSGLIPLYASSAATTVPPGAVDPSMAPYGPQRRKEKSNFFHPLPPPSPHTSTTMSSGWMNERTRASNAPGGGRMASEAGIGLFNPNPNVRLPVPSAYGLGYYPSAHFGSHPGAGYERFGTCLNAPFDGGSGHGARHEGYGEPSKAASLPTSHSDGSAKHRTSYSKTSLKRSKSTDESKSNTISLTESPDAASRKEARSSGFRKEGRGGKTWNRGEKRGPSGGESDVVKQTDSEDWATSDAGGTG